MQLECFVTTEDPPKMIPGRGDRQWMDAFASRFPYRCLPLVMANTTGWEIICPYDITVIWNGQNAKSDLTVSKDGAVDEDISHFATSHFSHGVLTFHTGYLFRTPPGYAVLAGGAPNHVKDGIFPLSGLVQTDWLPFPFTMNWLMTGPGMIEFKKDEPFCFIQVVEHKAQDEVQPVIKSIYDEPELFDQYQTWSKLRTEFNQNLLTQTPENARDSWQKFYFKGQKPDSEGKPVETVDAHVNRRRLNTPIWSPTALPYKGKNWE